MMRRLSALFGAVVMMASLAVTWGAVAADAPDVPTEVNVAYFGEWPTANQVAQVEGWYDEAMGVRVNWVPFETGNEMAEAMAAGEIQIAYSMGIVPFVIAVSEGASLTAVGVAVAYGENDNCVVSSKAAIDKANAKELEGRRVSVPLGTVAHYKMLRTLEHLGVDVGRLELVDLAPAAGVEALAEGEVTMACGWGGALWRMKEHGQVLMSAEEQEDIGIRTFDVIAVTDAFARDYPDLVTTFLDVTDRAIMYLENQPDEAKAVIAKAAGMDLKASNIVLWLFTFYRRDEQLSEQWMGGTVQALTKEIADFLVKQGQMPKALEDYGPKIDPRFYRAVGAG